MKRLMCFTLMMFLFSGISLAVTSSSLSDLGSGGDFKPSGLDLDECLTAYYWNGDPDLVNGCANERGGMIDPPAWCCDDLTIGAPTTLLMGHFYTADSMDDLVCDFGVWPDAGGMPGTVGSPLYEIWDIASTRDWYGSNWGFDLWMYHVPLPGLTLDPAGTYWIGMRPVETDGAARAFWLTAPGNGTSEAYFVGPYWGINDWVTTTYEFGAPYDLAWCVDASSGPTVTPGGPTNTPIPPTNTPTPTPTMAPCYTNGTIIWDQSDGTCGNNLGSSQLEPSGGLDSEIADDFVLLFEETINVVEWWGGYWNGDPVQPDGFNISFWTTDAGCLPLTQVYTTFVPYDGCNEQEDCDYYNYYYCAWIPELTLAPGQYMIVVQCVMDSFPQWGWRFRDASTDCDIAFRSAYFGFPNWTPGAGIFGQPYDTTWRLIYAQDDTPTPLPTNTPTDTPTPICPMGSTQITHIDEAFETWPPAGMVINNLGGTCVWESSGTTGRTNYTGGTGLCADADSDWCGPGTTMDTEMVAGPFDWSNPNLVQAGLMCLVDYNDITSGGGDFAAIDVSIDGSSWTTEIMWDADITTAVSLDLSGYLGNSTVWVRWHYYAASWDWWYEVDDAIVYSCESAPPPTSTPAVTSTPAPIPTTGPFGLGILVLLISGLLGFSALRRK